MEIEQIINHSINYVSTFIEIIGVVIVFYGSIKAAKYLVVREFLLTDLTKKRHQLRRLRYDFGYNLILALEFFLAGDVISTAINPTWDQLGKLGALILIRSTLTFVITKEALEHNGENEI